MTDRAISNILGYTFMFAIILTSVLAISVVAVGELGEIRENEQLNNAERGLYLVGQNVDEIAGNRAVTRTGEIELNGGSVGITESGTSNIRVEVSGSNDDFDETIPMRALRYDLGESTIAYESGAIIRRDRTGMVMQDEPSFTCTGDRAVVSIVTLYGDTDRQLGSGTVSIRVSENESLLRFPHNRSGPNSTDGTSTVTVTTTSEFADSWSRHLNAQSDWVDTGPNEFECQNVETYYVRQTVVNVTFTR